MARYIGPVCRLCRREGMKLFLKGERATRTSARSSGAPARAARPAAPQALGYGEQLREKQKVKRIYGISSASSAATSRRPSGRGITGETLLQLLERRLDNVVYRLGFAVTREARQLVRHGHFTVNGRKVNIPSYSCRGATS